MGSIIDNHFDDNDIIIHFEQFSLVQKDYHFTFMMENIGEKLS